jgi:CRP-like cAMP-binding protein
MTLGPDEKGAWLAKVPLFAGCSDDVVEQLAAVSADIGFAADHAIVQQGQVGNGLYIIVSGGARIVAGSEELARFGPGDFIGELSVIDQRPRTASAYAIGPTTCLALASWDLVAVLEREPRLAMNLLKELAGRLRRADDQLRD